jgi:micrococcal nuclease
VFIDVNPQLPSRLMNRQRAYYRSYRSVWGWLIVAVIVLWRMYAAPQMPAGPEVLEEGVHVVQRVVDGDTLLLGSGARVRLQGIDTPETVAEDRPVEAWGPEASQFTRDFVAHAGGRLRLTFSLERRDRYDRFLAFAWNGEVMLNEELVRAGLAEARLDFRYSNTMKRRMAAAQEEAKRAGRGIWSAGNGK